MPSELIDEGCQMARVQMILEGLDGNAWNLLGAFAANARRQGWPQQAIDAVWNEAMSGDYNHLLNTLGKNTEPPEEADV